MRSGSSLFFAVAALSFIACTAVDREIGGNSMLPVEEGAAPVVGVFCPKIDHDRVLGGDTHDDELINGDLDFWQDEVANDGDGLPVLTDDEDILSPCASVECGEHASCRVGEDGAATCRCDYPYLMSEGACLSDNGECSDDVRQYAAPFPSSVTFYYDGPVGHAGSGSMAFYLDEATLYLGDLKSNTIIVEDQLVVQRLFPSNENPPYESQCFGGFWAVEIAIPLLAIKEAASAGGFFVPVSQGVRASATIATYQWHEMIINVPAPNGITHQEIYRECMIDEASCDEFRAGLQYGIHLCRYEEGADGDISVTMSGMIELMPVPVGECN
jgi:hypothetical protein